MNEKAVLRRVATGLCAAMLAVPTMGYAIGVTGKTAEAEQARGWNAVRALASQVNDRMITEKEQAEIDAWKAKKEAERIAAEEAERLAAEEAERAAAEAAAYEETYYAYDYYDDGTYIAPDYGSYQNGSGLTKSGGVNPYNGRLETWYSSNTLRHYRIGEWTAGDDGVYRDADGYVVVAASDRAQGDIIDTSFGEGKVYDSGCAAGVSDIYVNW